jgi:hypothetical protein
MSRLLICFPFWEGDKANVEQVAQLACDLLEQPTDQAEVLFVARFDADFPSLHIQQEAAKKFAKMHLWRCTRKGVGFPAGCNEIALGIFEHVQTMEGIDAILILEGDCVITRRSWVKELCDEWKRIASAGKLVSGTLQQSGKWGGDIEEHINASALWDSDMLCYLPCLKSCPPHRGWDHHHGPKIIPYAVDSPLFKLDYKRNTIGSEELFSSGALIYHGVKDDSALKAVREKYQL